MHGKHEMGKYRDCAEDPVMSKTHQQDKEDIFIDFWYSVIEDSWFLIQKYPLKELMDKLERIIIISALSRFDGNQRKTAKFLDMKPTTLSEKIKKYNISFRKIPF